MPAIAGVVLSYVALVTGNPGTSAVQDDICALDAAACELSDVGYDLGYDEAIYATPAEVDCPANFRTASNATTTMTTTTIASTDRPNDPRLFSGGCLPPSLDFHYRVSRFPDSERPNGAVAPQRGRRVARNAAAWTGLPPDHARVTTWSPPPLAVYAVAQIVPPTAARVVATSNDPAPHRVLEPLDRPPRV